MRMVLDAPSFGVLLASVLPVYYAKVYRGIAIEGPVLVLAGLEGHLLDLEEL